MVYSIILRVWALVPKWLLVGLVACFFAYYTGVSHGREPYKLAAKVQEAKATVIARAATKEHQEIDEREKVLNETIEIDYCTISDADARKLSNYKGG